MVLYSHWNSTYTLEPLIFLFEILLCVLLLKQLSGLLKKSQTDILLKLLKVNVFTQKVKLLSDPVDHLQEEISVNTVICKLILILR